MILDKRTVSQLFSFNITFNEWMGWNLSQIWSNRRTRWKEKRKLLDLTISKCVSKLLSIHFSTLSWLDCFYYSHLVCTEVHNYIEKQDIKQFWCFLALKLLLLFTDTFLNVCVLSMNKGTGSMDWTINSQEKVQFQYYLQTRSVDSWSQNLGEIWNKPYK